MDKLAKWESEAASAVRIALEATWRERCAVMGKGWCMAYVPGSLRVICCPAHDVPSHMTKFLDLLSLWGNDTALIHAMDVLRKLPTLVK